MVAVNAERLSYANWRIAAWDVIKRAQEILLLDERGKPALDYLKGRGITEETAIKNFMGYVPHFARVGGYNVPSGITIPTFSEGLRQIRTRNLTRRGPKYMSMAGGKLSGSIWGIDFLKPGEPVLIFEGEFNAMIARQLGYQAIATCSAVNRLPDEFLFKLVAAPVVLSWFDDDKAGDMARSRLPSSVRHIRYPQDLNDLYLADAVLAKKVLAVWVSGVQAGLTDDDIRDILQRGYSWIKRGGGWFPVVYDQPKPAKPAALDVTFSPYVALCQPAMFQMPKPQGIGAIAL